MILNTEYILLFVFFSHYFKLDWKRVSSFSVQLIGTLRYHDGDDNENVKKAMG